MPLDLEAGAGRAVPGQLVEDATVWGVADYPDDRSWVRPLPAPVLEDIDRALPGLRAPGLPSSQVTAAHFPLPNSHEFLEESRRMLELGPGFTLLSGFPVDRYSDADMVLAYTGFMAHFGNISIQSGRDEYIVNVSDKGIPVGAAARGHYSRDALPFHADGANAVSLLCAETAASGGKSLLVSGAAIYNAMVREHSEYLPILYRGFHHHRREERGPDGTAAAVVEWRTPVFGFYGDRFHIIYIRPSIDWCEKEGVVISAEERAALDFVDEVIARPETQVSMGLRRGDLQIVNNFLVLHSRTEYSDAADRQRRLVRIWIDNPDALHNGPGKMDWYMPEHSRFLKTRGHLLEGYPPTG